MARRRRALAFALTVATLGATAAFAWCEVERESACIVELADVPAAPVAIVLGACVYDDGSLCLVLEDRLAMALELHRAGKASKLIVSGDHGTRAYDEPTAMARWLERKG